MQVDELRMMKLVHDVNLLLDDRFLDWMRYGYEFGSKDVSAGLFSASMNHAKCSATIAKQIVPLKDRCE